MGVFVASRKISIRATACCSQTRISYRSMSPHLSWLILLLFVATQGIALGAGLYEQRIVVPQWMGRAASGEPYLNADAIRTADTGRRFWGFVTTGPLTLLTLASLGAAWQAQGALQAWWLGSALVTLVERIATFGYFIPVAIRLMRAEAPVPASVRAQALQWRNFNRARLALSGLALLLGLMALSPPL